MKANYVAALKKSAGIMGPAMAAVGIEYRSTIWRWRQDDPEFDEACNEAQERALDMAETALFKNIQSGDTQAIKFLLSCKGKDRGYVEHNQLDINATVTRPRIVYEDDPAALNDEAREYSPED